jgi:peptidoglycan/xylan/chitin deacetylase (PgdA/CDA1 family)
MEKRVNIAIVLTVLLVISASVIYYYKNTTKQTLKIINYASQTKIASPEATLSGKPKQSSNSNQEQANLASGYCLNVPVLMYHHIEPQEQAKTEGHTALNVDSNIFASQMAYLSSKGYTAITADQLALALKNHNKLPSRSIVLTFDDGYSDFYTYALPIIKQYSFKANLMIPTGLIENSGYMSWEQLKDAFSSGNATIYNHTWSHALLGSASTQKIGYEISTANKQLSNYLGQTPNIFTYPYGSNSTNVVSYLAEHGFIAAFSEIPGTYQCDSFIMNLHRTRIGNSSLASYGL